MPGGQMYLLLHGVGVYYDIQVILLSPLRTEGTPYTSPVFTTDLAFVIFCIESRQTYWLNRHYVPVRQYIWLKFWLNARKEKHYEYYYSSDLCA